MKLYAHPPADQSDTRALGEDGRICICGEGGAAAFCHLTWESSPRQSRFPVCLSAPDFGLFPPAEPVKFPPVSEALAPGWVGLCSCPLL